MSCLVSWNRHCIQDHAKKQSYTGHREWSYKEKFYQHKTPISLFPLNCIAIWLPVHRPTVESNFDNPFNFYLPKPASQKQSPLILWPCLNQSIPSVVDFKYLVHNIRSLLKWLQKVYTNKYHCFNKAFHLSVSLHNMKTAVKD